MSSPYQRTRALVQTKELLRVLEDAVALPGVPDAVRQHAAAVLKHFPTLGDLQRVHEALPNLFGPPPPFSRMRGNPQTDAVIAAGEGLGNAGDSRAD
ncbi:MULTISPECIES: BPSL0761 family protein [Ramlibacter]|uniref:BPSL0761 family protein n=1 Tax=Ramlibacter TaxID=174951 RepID=UPI00351AB7E8